MCRASTLVTSLSKATASHGKDGVTKRNHDTQREQDEQSVDEVNKPGAAHRWTELRGSAAVFQAVCCSVSRTLKKAFI